MELISKIYLVLGQKVMIDHDLSGLYAVETKQLNSVTGKQQYSDFGK